MRASLAVLGIFAGVVAGVAAQQQSPPQPAIPQRFAPIDLTGTWVSIVTEDWRFRMVTPPKGDYASVPLTAGARKIADSWDPAKDEAEGNVCKSYGAPAIMRVPGRVRFSWQDNGNALKIETDAGQQTRLLHFDTAQPPSGDAGWQGFSAASWEYAGNFNPNNPGGGRGGPGGAGRGGPAPGVPPPGGALGAPPPGGGPAGGRGGGPAGPQGGTLTVVTTHIKPGYLRKNGVPYSEDTVLTEYFDRHTDPSPGGGEWFVVTTIVHDPKNLTTDFITSSHFRKEADDSKWHPVPCKAQ